MIRTRSRSRAGHAPRSSHARKALALAAALVLVPVAASAQTGGGKAAGRAAQVPGAGTAADRAAVHAAALDYIEGFYQGDSTRLVRSVARDVFKYGYARRPEGYAGMQMSYEGFMDFARGVREGRNRPPANAPKEIVLYEVEDQIANVKVTAWWGIDYLLLGKRDGRWLITHVTWQSPPQRPAK